MAVPGSHRRRRSVRRGEGRWRLVLGRRAGILLVRVSRFVGLVLVGIRFSALGSEPLFLPGGFLTEEWEGLNVAAVPATLL